MAPTLTSRLQLSKPDPNDFVNVLTDLDGNYDKIDLLDKKPSPITQPFVKRNQIDTINSGTQSVLETLSIALKTNHWYELTASFRYNTSVAVGGSPTPTGEIKYKVGGTVATSDPPLCRTNMTNCNTASPRLTISTIFDVPTSATYTLGLCVDSGSGANTITMLASGGTDNTGFDRCLWVKDLGEK